VKSDVSAPNTGIVGSGPVLVVENNADNSLVTLRFEFASTKMQAAEDAFDAAGHHFGAGAFIIQNADRAAVEPALKQLNLTAYAVASTPSVKTHDLDIPRIGYVHSWTRTQDEGWVRAAFDHYGVPYTYFGEPKLKEGNLRAKFDVIVYPHGGTALAAPGGGRGGAGGAGGGGGEATGAVAAGSGDKPIPYKRTAEFQAIGFPDSTDDIRGAVGEAGFKALYEFVQQGGTLITEGSTSSILPDLGLTPGVKVENPPTLFARGTILRGVIADAKSPLVYGYQHSEVPVYFSSGPVLNAGAGAPPPVTMAGDTTNRAAPNAGGPGAPAATPGRNAARPQGQNVTPMAVPLKLSGWDPDHTGSPYGQLPQSRDDSLAAAGRGGRGGGGGGGGFGGGGFGGGNRGPQSLPGVTADPSARTRVVLQFPTKAEDMLLSGTLEGGNTLQSRAQLVDESVGQGHIVMFAIRPFWRWQTQGTFAMGFNAILNWNDLDAGKAAPAPQATGAK
jgi:hypothetical protein